MSAINKAEAAAGGGGAGVEKGPALFVLPQSLSFEISKFLPPADQVLFSLSCKPLFELFNSSISWRKRIDEALRFTRGGGSVPSGEKCVLLLPRTQLLMRLENPKWAFCCGCLKLHLREEYEPPLPRHPLFLAQGKDEDKVEEEHGCDGVEKKPLRPCMARAGIVDVCDCILLTIRDRNGIVDYLKTLSRFAFYSNSSVLNEFKTMKRFKGLFQPSVHVCGAMEVPCLLHECSVARVIDGETQNARIQTRLFQLSGELRMKALIEMPVSYYQALPFLERCPIFTCPHIDTVQRISWSCTSEQCYDCDADMSIETLNDKVVWELSRAFGNSSDRATDSLWELQCREESCKCVDRLMYKYAGFR